MPRSIRSLQTLQLPSNFAVVNGLFAPVFSAGRCEAGSSWMSNEASFRGLTEDRVDANWLKCGGVSGGDKRTVDSGCFLLRNGLWRALSSETFTGIRFSWLGWAPRPLQDVAFPLEAIGPSCSFRFCLNFVILRFSLEMQKPSRCGPYSEGNVAEAVSWKWFLPLTCSI